MHGQVACITEQYGIEIVAVTILTHAAECIFVACPLWCCSGLSRDKYTRKQQSDCTNLLCLEVRLPLEGIHDALEGDLRDRLDGVWLALAVEYPEPRGVLFILCPMSPMRYSQSNSTPCRIRSHLRV